MLKAESLSRGIVRGTAGGGENDAHRAAAGADPGHTARPHICFVAPYAWPVFSRDPSIQVVGGAEVQQSILARLFARAGYRVSMICIDYGQGPREQIDGVTVHKTYRADSGIPVLRFLHPRLTQTWRALREVNADIYYQRSSAMLTGIVAEFCRLHGKRSIYAGASDVDFMPGRQPIRYRRDRWLFERGLARVDRIVVQNKLQQANCLRHYGRASVLIPSCYELPQDARPRVGELVLWVGMIRANKRAELFLDMARRLPHRRFVMVGGAGPDLDDGGAYFKRVRDEAATLANVEFAGFLPLAKVEPYFDRARVFVNTSTYEGMPNTFMQAWARGIPTIATVEVGARFRGEPVYRCVAGAQEGAAEVERLFCDEIHRARASARCRDYFNGTHASEAVLVRYARLFDELMQASE